MTTRPFDNNGEDLRFVRPDTEFICRAAALIIHDDKLLVASHTNFPGLYYTIGGTIKATETSEEAILREIREETDIELEIDRLAFINERFYIVKGTKFHRILFFYLMKYRPELSIPENTATDLAGEETLLWLPLTSLSSYNLVPSWLKTKRLDNIVSMEHIISKEY